MVTSRATDDNLTDDQDPRTSGIMAEPRPPLGEPLSQPTAAKPAKTAAPADAVSDGMAGGGVSPNGGPATGQEDSPTHGGPAAADATVVDGIPALPADTIGSPRSTGSAKPDANQAAGNAEPAVKPTGDDPAGPGPSGTGPVPGASSWAGSATPGGGSDAPAGSHTAPADPPSVSPAAFAWEMPDPPANSRSSPARAFLRSGLTAKKPAGSKTGPSAGPGKAAAAGAAAAKTPGAQGAQSKRTARQAHLTVARVEPWSVMKFSFVVSLVAFVILFVAVSVLYGTLAGLGVFDSLQRVVSDVTSSQGSPGVNAKTWWSASRVLGYTALLGSVNIVLITAMSTIGAVVYNLTSRLVGGVEVTLKETE